MEQLTHQETQTLSLAHAIRDAAYTLRRASENLERQAAQLESYLGKVDSHSELVANIQSELVTVLPNCRLDVLTMRAARADRAQPVSA